MRGESNNRLRVALPLQRSQRGVSIHLGHLNVHQDNIEFFARSNFDGLPAVDCKFRFNTVTP
jgi:hypothetical protein